MKTLIYLVRRELWEHKSLWIVPVVAAAVLPIISLVELGIGGWEHAAPTWSTADSAEIASTARREFAMVAMLIQLATAVTILVYTIDCLYSERRNRSILFWKTLPVSDAMTVGSKLFTAAFLAPLFGLIATIIFQLFQHFITWILGSPDNWWSAAPWLENLATLGLSYAAFSLWYLPGLGLLLLISAAARRAVYLWVVVPLVAAGFAEQLVLKSTPLTNIIGAWLAGPIWRLSSHQIDSEVCRMYCMQINGVDHDIPAHVGDLGERWAAGGMQTSFTTLAVGAVFGLLCVFAAILLRRRYSRGMY